MLKRKVLLRNSIQQNFIIVGCLVASSGLEVQILVEILWIPDFHDQNALLPEHFQGGNCLSDSVFFKITSNIIEVVDMSTHLHINS